MATAFFGALIALSALAAVLLISDTYLTIRSTHVSVNGDIAAPRYRFFDLAKSHCHSLSIAVFVALVLASLAGAELSSDATMVAADPPSTAGTAMESTYDKLRQFAAVGEGATTSRAMSLIPAASTGLPDVGTMIEQLSQRLEKEPNDAEGWRMLGWSYFNTSRYDEAASAYDKAIALSPGNAELVAARDQARQMTASEGKGPSRADVNAAAEMSEQDRASMIAGMVDGLARRLAQSPKDKAGWVELMRARVVLKQPDTAVQDLQSAKQAFSGEPEVLARLTEAARAMGVPGP